MYIDSPLRPSSKLTRSEAAAHRRRKRRAARKKKENEHANRDKKESGWKGNRDNKKRETRERPKNTFGRKNSFGWANCTKDSRKIVTAISSVGVVPIKTASGDLGTTTNRWNRFLCAPKGAHNDYAKPGRCVDGSSLADILVTRSPLNFRGVNASFRRADLLEHL